MRYTIWQGSGSMDSKRGVQAWYNPFMHIWADRSGNVVSKGGTL